MAAVIYAGVHPFELAVPCEVFGLDRSELGVPWYDFFVASVDPPPVGTFVEGFSINTAYGLDDLARADTLVFPGWDLDRPVPAPLIKAVRDAEVRGARLLSVCTGVFVLAAAGLLEGRRATCHWMNTDDLRNRHPEVTVEPDVLYVDEGRVKTSAGTAAGIDLCLHVVREDFGTEIANAAARRMVVPPHRDGGQAQFVDTPIPDDPGEDHVAQAMSWALENLSEEITVPGLAAQVAMSPRHFARRFREVTGTTPHRWLVRQRVLHAQRLLETTDLPVERVATDSGFGTAANLRQHFRRQVRTTPAAYRRTFRRASEDLVRSSA